MSTLREHRASIGAHIIQRQTTIKKVHFQLPSNLKGTLLNFTQGHDHRGYQDLVCILRDSEIKDEDLCLLLSDAQDCISLMDQNLRLFIQVLLVVKWAHRDPKPVKAFQSFLLTLCSAHNYHTKAVLDHLVGHFKPNADAEWRSGFPSKEEENVYQNIHYVLRKLLKLIPMASGLLLNTLALSYPYFKRPAADHLAYVHNMLSVLHYQPHFRKEFLSLIVNRMVQLDVSAPRADIEAAEDDDEDDMDVDMFTMDEEQNMKHSIGNTLDLLMLRLFKFFESQCSEPSTGEQNLDKSVAIYKDVMKVFEEIILVTHNTHHVQFLVWYVCSLRPKLAEFFLNYLMRLVSGVQVPPVTRQTAATYIASFLARCNFIKIEFLKTVLQDMSDWIHTYIGNQDGQGSVDTRMHSVFYSVCQGLFYVVAFRHKDLFNTRKNMNFLRGLNMSKIVTCGLNPLKVCLPDIGKRFASVTRSYQLVYCNSVLERNARNTVPVVHTTSTGLELTGNCLETFFPFDPYKLRKSSALINPNYNVYQAAEVKDESTHKPTNDDDDDDYLPEPMNSAERMFTYSASPGFLQDSYMYPPFRQHI